MYLKGIFLNGLRKKVRAKTKLHYPKTLAEMIIIVEMVDEKNRAKEEEEAVAVLSKRTGVSNKSSG